MLLKRVINHIKGLFSSQTSERHNEEKQNHCWYSLRAKRQTPSAKETLYMRQEGFCFGCHIWYPERLMTIDHIVPRSKGGHNDISNKQILCYPCNTLKANGTMRELQTELQIQGVLKNRPLSSTHTTMLFSKQNHQI